MIDNSKILYAKVPVKIRKSPDINSESLGTLNVGEKVEIISMTPTWIQHTRGWSVRKFFSDNIEEVFRKSNTASPNKFPYTSTKSRYTMASRPMLMAEGDEVPDNNKDASNDKPLDPNAGGGNTGDMTKIDEDGNATDGKLVGSESVPVLESRLSSLLTSARGDVDFSSGLRGLWGMPFAFTDIADPIPGSVLRSNDEGRKWFYGRVYSETFLSDMPVLVITAGVPSFMTQASQDDRASVMTVLAATTNDKEEKISAEDAGAILDNAKAGLEYFTFKEQMIEYYGYVNFMCQGIASFLNLEEQDGVFERVKGFFLDPIIGVNIKDHPAKINWYDYPQFKEMEQLFGESYTTYIACYVDPGSGGSESISNSTTQSILAGINSLSDKTRDMGFMFAHMSENDMKMYSSSVNEQLTQDFAKTQMDSNMSQRFNAMINSSAAVLKNGGKMIFPDIWSDSQYNKSYNISAKFHSPYGDKFSIFLHVLVPFVHLFCLAAPRQLGVNGIMSPFLVRAYVKGDFSCSMGIIDSFSFKKGGSGDAWTLDGLPSSIEVDFSIAELYSSISISRVENLSDALSLEVSGLNYPLSNTVLLDFMANLTACDLNVNQFSRKVKLVLIYLQAKYSGNVSDVPRKIARKVRQAVGVVVRKMGFNNNL